MRNYKSTFGMTECRGEIILHWNNNAKQGLRRKETWGNVNVVLNEKKNENFSVEELI